MTIWGGYTPTIGDITSSNSSGRTSSGSGLTNWRVGNVPYIETAVESTPATADNSSGRSGQLLVSIPQVEEAAPVENNQYGDNAAPSQELDLSRLLDAQTEPSRGYVRDDGTVGPTPENNEVKTDTIKPVTPTPTEKLEEAAKKMDNVYRPMGDDYDIDTDAAFAAAQAGTGDNQLASSISGSSSGGKGTQNSNTNDGIFGGQSNKANPGYSLW